MAQSNAHRSAGGMGSVTGIVLAVAMLAATGFVFLNSQSSSASLVWAEDAPSEETVVAAVD